MGIESERDGLGKREEGRGKEGVKKGVHAAVVKREEQERGTQGVEREGGR